MFPKDQLSLRRVRSPDVVERVLQLLLRHHTLERRSRWRLSIWTAPPRIVLPDVAEFLPHLVAALRQLRQPALWVSHPLQLSRRTQSPTALRIGGLPAPFSRPAISPRAHHAAQDRPVHRWSGNAASLRCGALTAGQPPNGHEPVQGL